MKNKVHIFLTILYFGAIWGILEASLGALLHMVPVPFLAGTIMFPIAAAVLIRAHMRLQYRPALLYVGMVAALIKSVNFLTPLNQWRVINPMISIIFESLLVVGLVTYMSKRSLPVSLAAFVTASVAWRSLYLGWFGLQFLLTGFQAAQITSLAAALEFTLFMGILSGLIALVFVRVTNMVARKAPFVYSIRPVSASLLFTLALVLAYIL